MKPKLWNGPSAVGEARDRFNRVIDTPYQTASGPGFRADKKNGFHEVFLEEEETGRELGLYLLIAKTENGIRCAASRKLKEGVFTTKPEHECTDWFVDSGRGSPYIFYYGSGLGAKLDSSGPAISRDATIFTTRTGSAFVSKHTVTLPLQGLLTMPMSILSGIKSEGKWHFGISTSYLSDGVPVAYYMHRINSTWYASEPSVPDIAVEFRSASRVVRINNTELLAVSYAADETAKTFTRFSRSLNNGLLWQPLDDITFLQEYADTPGNTALETLEIGASMTSFPTSDGKALIYFKWLDKGAGEFEHRIYGYSNGVLTYQTFLFKSALPWEMVTPTESVGWPLVLQFVLSGDPDTKHVLFTKNGPTWSADYALWESYNTGRISFVEKDFMVCPVYDSEKGYVIYGWKPGQTPKKVAKIKTELAAPNPLVHTGLLNFNTLLKVQDKDGSSAKGHPGLPWIG